MLDDKGKEKKKRLDKGIMNFLIKFHWPYYFMVLLLSAIHAVLNDYLAIIDKNCNAWAFFIGVITIISSCIILAIVTVIITIGHHCMMKTTAMNRPQVHLQVKCTEYLISLHMCVVSVHA